MSTDKLKNILKKPWSFYNNNTTGPRDFQFVPINQGDLDDCTVRALTIALNYDYYVVVMALQQQAKFLKIKDFKDWENVKAFMKAEGFVKMEPKKIYKVKDFVKQHPKGIYILSLKEHVTTLVNGTIYDTWDTTNERYYTAYRLEERYY